MAVNSEMLLLSSKAILPTGKVTFKKVFWETIRLEIKVLVRKSTGNYHTVKQHWIDWSKSCNLG